VNLLEQALVWATQEDNVNQTPPETMLQRSKVQRDRALNGTTPMLFRLLLNRDSGQLARSKTAGFHVSCTGILALVIIGACAQTTSGIDVYPNNAGRWRTA